MKWTKRYNLVYKAALVLAVALAGRHLPAQTGSFEVVSRQPLPAGTPFVLGAGTGNNVKTYRLAGRGGQPAFEVMANGQQFYIDALSYMDYAPAADRIVSWGDDPNAHVVTKVSMRMYTSSGVLVRAVDNIAYYPFAAMLAPNGDFVIAGNRTANNTSKYMVCFDKNGIKQWERTIENIVPVQLHVAPDRRFIGLFGTDGSRRGFDGRLAVYSGTGQPLFTDESQKTFTGMEFLPGDKMVVAAGPAWKLSSIGAQPRQLASGWLQGNAVGRFPVAAYPAHNAFLMVSLSSNSQYQVQAFDAAAGNLMASEIFEGRPHWQNYRTLEVLGNGAIRLLTNDALLELRLRP